MATASSSKSTPVFILLPSLSPEDAAGKSPCGRRRRRGFAVILGQADGCGVLERIKDDEVWHKEAADQGRFKVAATDEANLVANRVLYGISSSDLKQRSDTQMWRPYLCNGSGARMQDLGWAVAAGQGRHNFLQGLFQWPVARAG